MPAYLYLLCIHQGDTYHGFCPIHFFTPLENFKVILAHIFLCLPYIYNSSSSSCEKSVPHESTIWKYFILCFKRELYEIYFLVAWFAFSLFASALYRQGATTRKAFASYTLLIQWGWFPKVVNVQRVEIHFSYPIIWKSIFLFISSEHDWIIAANLEFWLFFFFCINMLNYYSKSALVSLLAATMVGFMPHCTLVIIENHKLMQAATS